MFHGDFENYQSDFSHFKITLKHAFNLFMVQDLMFNLVFLFGLSLIFNERLFLLSGSDKAYFVDLFVRASNTPAIKMYEKVDFLF